MSDTNAGHGGPNRRDFLKAAGFTFAGGLLLSGCQPAPEQQAIPPLNQLEDIVAGQARYYASTCDGCRAGCGMLVKTYDGRPIKLEGFPQHPLSQGGLCATGQASLLGLYDRFRLQHPLSDGQEASWDEIDNDIRKRLDEVRRQGKAVRILSSTITSPTTQAMLQRFLKFAGAQQVAYDPVSCSAILDAHERTHGVRALPHYHLDRRQMIVSFDADFLGTWLSPVEFTHAYRSGRSLTGALPVMGASTVGLLGSPLGQGPLLAASALIPGRALTGNPPRPSDHIQIESRLSLTGSKADERLCVAPEEIRGMMVRLAVALSRLAGAPLDADDALSSARVDFCIRLAERLWQVRQAGGHSLVLCGSQDVPTQVACNFINDTLKNYGATLDIKRPSRQRQGSDGDLAKLRDDLNADKIGALFILDSNPVYDLPDGESLAQTLRQMHLVVCCGERMDETARAAHCVCPHPHYLESWGDAEAVSGVLGLRQPTIPRQGDTRPVIESLAAWMGEPKPVYDQLRQYWKDRVFPRQAKHPKFDDFWDHSVQDGYAEVDAEAVTVNEINRERVQAALQSPRPADGGRTLLLYPKVGMPDGGHAYNPWLQEMPDPISKVTWDNYACLSPETAAQLGIDEGDVVRLEVRDDQSRTAAMELPMRIQQGQHDRVVAVALGYGSILSERFAGIGSPWLEAGPTVGENGRVGQNAAALLGWNGGTLLYARPGVEVTKTGKKHPLAATQIYDTLILPAHLAPPGQERRPLVQEVTLGILTKTADKPAEEEKPANLWPKDHPCPERRWGMVIDLNACTGCSACVIACQAENNVPVVGRDEISRQREMHWLRIDRYYSGTGSDVEVAYQPMLCHHCERAPCETVCPVLATVHSAEGLNEQVYNRCVGTRYCANNCPYKVRRFNWFAYAHDDKLQNLALNPDVTVRSRGVMEKCTFCVQRLQEAKIEARHQGKLLHDGEVQTACQQSCPAQAIVFGDLNDRTSQVAKLREDRRHYHTLAELNIGPAVGYLKVVRPDKGAVPKGDG